MITPYSGDPLLTVFRHCRMQGSSDSRGFREGSRWGGFRGEDRVQRQSALHGV